MTYETAFSLAGLVAMAGWLILLASPWIPTWSDRLAGVVLPLALSAGYLILVLIPSTTSGGFDKLANVMELFSKEHAMLSGWIHFLAFDLFIGAWVCRRARLAGIRFMWVLPTLPLIFLFGPIGLLAFFLVYLIFGKPDQDALSGPRLNGQSI